LKNQISNLLFDLLVVGLLGGAVVWATRWPFETALFPLAIGVPVLVLALFQLGKDALALSLGQSQEGSLVQESIPDVPTDRSVPFHLVAKRAGAFYGSAIGLYLLVLIVGFHAAAVFFLVGFLRFYGQASWSLVLLLTAGVLLLMVGLFDQLLHVPWPEPLIRSLFERTTG
jgi:hypothetical protein